ncbi:glycerophosphodiester phosphodiesterase [Mangrovihabitans endophyticus]|uniref:Glycerophosphoryl diester phosphodiesterase n=1 Tax=Mangrovihabitans endophyticus TaxID=1751298 RepID=A0A8J3FRM2_9ACTN|nr:glycerophosphodiester phosphodiesterase [Mangrovihabitans endophyticus]GGL08216.1 glycerophosphoryl diester phosphodiesterase [Mangrovihabitans endophyticus]
MTRPTSTIGRLLALGSLLTLVGCQSAAPATKPAAAAEQFCAPLPDVIAHRGGTEKSMENTVGAFTAAGEAGVTLWELDVHFDVHGVPVVLHDDTVDRVSPMSGDISTLDVSKGIPTDDGQHIPTLDEVYRVAERFDAHVLTEIKVVPTEAQWAAVADDIDRTIGRPGVTLMSFDRSIVRTAEEEFPDTSTGLIHGAGYLSPEQIHQYGDVFSQSQTSISASRARQWHDGDVDVYAWTVDKEADWQRLSAWPVAGFITNKPIAYTEWAEKQC